MESYSNSTRKWEDLFLTNDLWLRDFVVPIQTTVPRVCLDIEGQNRKPFRYSIKGTSYIMVQ